MAKVFSGDNPSQLYLDALTSLVTEGDEVSPRGKRVKELRPVIFEFTNPLNRVTFLKGRKINPFFQMAEALWILAGRADVKWLTNYNASISQFSDDGVWFNAPYGQRLRNWNENSLIGFIFNPIDQLTDVYEKIKKDTDTRQAVASIYNPIFDNVHYEGKDTPCNLTLTFKVRQGKLQLTVFNRSNDIHWGVFGANLCQFATIQEVVASWLGVEVGTYSQITDSLHVYLDDYGAKETDKVLNAYGLDKDSLEGLEAPLTIHFSFENEPRLTLGKEEFDGFLEYYFDAVDPFLQNDEFFKEYENAITILSMVDNAKDAYLRNTLLSMVAYRAHKLGMSGVMVDALSKMVTGQWKVSCLMFLYPKYKDMKEFTDLYANYDYEISAYIEGR